MNRRGANRTGPLGGAGMVAQWGGSSLIKSVQSGLAAILSGNTSATATITSVDTANSIAFLLGWHYQTDSDDLTQIIQYVTLTNSTTLTFTKNSSSGSSSGSASYMVLEFVPGVVRSIQRGTITMGGTQTSNTATITAVNTAKSFIPWSGHLGSAGSASMASMWGRLALTNSTTVTLSRDTGTSGLTASYQVVEFF